MSCTLFRFSVTQENDGSTLRTFLRRSCGITARSMTLLKNIGGIYRGDVLIKARDIVSAGDVITLRLPEEVNGFVISGKYKYGKIALTVYKRDNSEETETE